MAITCQAVIDGARVDLNDDKEDGSDANARYKDTQMLGFLNEFIALAYSVRPDLRFGSAWGEVADLAVTDDFPLSTKFRMPAMMYVQARCSGRDDEYAVAQRFTTFLQLGISTTEKA